MSEHTKEPWRIGNLQSYDAYTGKPFRNVWAGPEGDSLCVARAIEHGDIDANARRIVAAVNACQGISTEALEAGAVEDLVRLIAAGDRLRSPTVRGADLPSIRNEFDMVLHFARLKLEGKPNG